MFLKWFEPFGTENVLLRVLKHFEVMLGQNRMPSKALGNSFLVGSVLLVSLRCQVTESLHQVYKLIFQSQLEVT